MKFNKKILVLVLLGAFTLSLVGLGLTSRTLANAASPQQAPASAQVTVPSASANTSQNSIAQQTEEKGTAIVQDKENESLEQGEKAMGVESEQDENLPGGGHQDPEGVEIDHQFEGVE